MSQTHFTAVVANSNNTVCLAIRRNARSLRNISFLGDVAAKDAVLPAIVTQRPDVAILDVHLTECSGKNVLDEIARKGMCTRVLLTTEDDRDECLKPVSWASALGFIYLPDTLELCLVPALRAMTCGLPYVSPTPLKVLRATFSEMHGATMHLRLLSAHEQDVLDLAIRGNTDKEIAAVMGLSVKTVERRKGGLRKKLGVRSTAELVAFAVRHGFVKS